MEPIQVIGIKDLEDVEIGIVNRIASSYYPKIQRELQNSLALVIHIKPYKKGGKYFTYSVHIRAIAPTRIFVSIKGRDKRIEVALRDGFDDILHQIHHRLHTDQQRQFMKRRAKGFAPLAEPFDLM